MYPIPILSPFLFIPSLYASFFKFAGFLIYLYIYNAYSINTGYGKISHRTLITWAKVADCNSVNVSVHWIPKTQRKSCCSSSRVRELQGWKADLGTLTAAVEAGITRVGVPWARRGMLGVMFCLKAPSTKSWFGVRLCSVDIGWLFAETLRAGKRGPTHPHC